MSREERRASPRIAAELEVKVDGPRGTLHLMARDLSAHGLFLECPRPLATGQQVECRMDLPVGRDTRRITCVAEVRHQSTTYRTTEGLGPFKGMGLRIVRITAEDHATLQRFLEG